MSNTTKEDPEEHEEDESSIKEEIEWFSNYKENSISVQKIQEIKTMTQEKEDEGTCIQNFKTNRGQSLAMQPNFLLDSRPPVEPESQFVPELPTDPPASSEEPEVEKLYSNLEFLSK